MQVQGVKKHKLLCDREHPQKVENTTAFPTSISHSLGSTQLGLPRVASQDGATAGERSCWAATELPATVVGAWGSFRSIVSAVGVTKSGDTGPKS